MVAIYARQSVERKDSVSIEAQIDSCKRYISTEYRVFSDVGYSGKNINRPQFELLLEEIKKGTIQTIICYRLDRISRSIADFAELLKFFEEYSVTFISATEQFDTSTPVGRAMIYIVMVFAQLERETIAERIKDNYRFRALQGGYLGGGTPFGYSKASETVNGKKVSYLVPNQEGEVLKQIFSLYISGYSMYSIASQLNAQNSTTTLGKSWTNTAIKRILQNISPCCADKTLLYYLLENEYAIASPYEHFDGAHGMCMFFKSANKNIPSPKELHLAVVGVHEPIIPSEMFILAQKRLEKSAPRKRKASKKSYLVGLITCKDCGYRFGIKETKKGGKTYTYLFCRGNAEKHLCDNSTYLPLKQVEDAINNDCIDYLKEIKIKAFEQQTDTANSESSIKLLQKQLENLITSVGKGTSDVDALLIGKVEEIKTNIRKLQNQQPTPCSENSELTEKILATFESMPDCDIPQLSYIFRKIFEKITINHNGEIELYYKF